MAELNTYVNDTDYSGAKNFMFKRSSKKVLSKKEYFVQQNVVSLYAAYIEEGIFHYTCAGKDGKKYIVGYSFENEFICDYSSFIKGGVFFSQHPDVNRLYHIHYFFKRLFRICK